MVKIRVEKAPFADGFPERCPLCGQAYSWALTGHAKWCSGIFHRCRDCTFNERHERISTCDRCLADPQRGMSILR